MVEELGDARADLRFSIGHRGTSYSVPDTLETSSFHTDTLCPASLYYPLRLFTASTEIPVVRSLYLQRLNWGASAAGRTTARRFTICPEKDPSITNHGKISVETLQVANPTMIPYI